MPMLAQAELLLFRRMIRERLGLEYPDDKLPFLEDAIARRLDATGLKDFEAYLGRLELDGVEERRSLAELLTVGESFFFRGPEQLQVFAGELAPELQRAAGARPLRVLSAGCAAGEEPYSLAMLELEAREAGAAWSLELHGLDLNPAALARASEGRYSDWALRQTPEAVRLRFFWADGGRHRLSSELLRSVRFHERNLVDEDPGFWQPGSWDAIFCRNVIMYFHVELARRVVARFAAALAPEGALFLGHAENLRGLSSDFHLCHQGETFFYRRKSDRIEEPAANAAWFETIGKASERIEELARSAEGATGGEDVGGPREAALARSPDDDSFPTTGSSPPWGLGLCARKGSGGEAPTDTGAGVPEKPPAPLLRPDTDTLLREALRLLDAGGASAAREILVALLDFDEFDPEAHYLLGLCLEHEGRVEVAAEQQSRAAYLDPGFAMPVLQLGRLLRRRGDAAEARLRLRQAAELLEREDVARVILFGGGFSRQVLIAAARRELEALEAGS